MSSQDEWLAWFAAKHAAGREWIAAEHRRIGALIESERVGTVAPARPLVYVSSHEIDAETLTGGPARVAVSAIAHGWAVKVWRSRAIHPVMGDLDVIGLLGERHDERVAACWWNGAFNAGFYVSHAGVERLAASSWQTRARSATTRAAKAGADAVLPTQRGLSDVIEGRRVVDVSLAAS